MRRWRLVLGLLAGSASGIAAAQTVVTSARPDAVAVTVYRNPERDPGEMPNLNWLNGYALISETRTIVVPQGESVVRFEGVASGTFAETAIVTGFPDGIVERNRDADLLSPRALLDRSLARRVHLRRTSLATGEVREEEAVIRTGAEGAVVLQTAEGFEALRCTGLPETLVYDGVPEGLNARPTMSVRLRSAAPTTATVTLSYLAAGFDWQANYLGTLSSDGRRLDLFAWLTLASMDETSFPDANTQAVAGQPNRERRDWEPSQPTEVHLRCWPQGRTHEISPGHYAAASYEAGGYEEGDQSIIVTGTRTSAPSAPPPAVTAEQEDLGDLKLYRIPIPVTVAARSQKQVALLRREQIPVRQLYRQGIDPDQASQGPMPAEWVLLARNRTRDGLGLPLPAGQLVLFGEGAARPIMLGAAAVRDHAVDEDVELGFGSAIGVMTDLRRVSEVDGDSTYELIVSNDHRRGIDFEARLPFSDIQTRARLEQRGAERVWRIRLPAGGRRTLRFTLPEDS